MIVRKRKTVMIEVEVDITADWRGESGGGKPTERWIENRAWSIYRRTMLDDNAYLQSLIDAAVYDIPEEELAE